MPRYCARPGGVRISYEDSGGEGLPAILFSHGFGSGSRLWRHQVAAFRGAFRCITYDMRGHALSDSPPTLTGDVLGAAGAYSKDHQVDDMCAVLDACGVRRAILCGHSMGGYDTLLCYFKYPERVAALVLCSTGPGYTKDKVKENEGLVWSYSAFICCVWFVVGKASREELVPSSSQTTTQNTARRPPPHPPPPPLTLPCPTTKPTTTTTTTTRLATLNSKARLGWNAQGEKIAAKYAERGLDGLRGSDREMGHRTVDGLVRACLGSYIQRWVTGDGCEGRVRGRGIREGCEGGM